jgi:hypothetical protein
MGWAYTDGRDGHDLPTDGHSISVHCCVGFRPDHRLGREWTFSRTPADLALLQTPGPDNGTMRALSVAVLKRQPDGAWKVVIDHPFGDAVLTKE